jgi:hypothetical protein
MKVLGCEKYATQSTRLPTRVRISMVKKVWSSDEDKTLRENYHLTNQNLSKIIGVDASTIKARYSALGVDRPVGKNALANARFVILREKNRGQVPEDFFDLPATRQDAKNLGISFYWTGTPCERAEHISRRKTSSGGCWECDYGDHLNKLRTDKDFAEKRNELSRKRYETNKDQYLANQREYKKKPEIREWHRQYEREKKQNDLSWRLSKSLRDRLYKAVTRDAKLSSSKKLVGCSIDELKLHLEKQFTEDMNWDNYGTWHIDHIKPCISFDLTDPNQQQECFHFNNLRPLWGFENRSKGGSWEGVDPRKQKRKTP